ncbi:MAG TPA: cyclic nucleotide-binding domain-containing protein [Lachnospiraceae bacterium]|nr:cyclic nucleotide-binding domain-containing protein [Lachnospiraceae bacterium]
MARKELCSHDACIAVVPIFNHLEKEKMEEIMGVTKSTSFKKEEIIYREGDTSDSLYIVSSGKVRIYRLSESGKMQLVRILYPGDFTGELALFLDECVESENNSMEIVLPMNKKI